MSHNFHTNNNNSNSSKTSQLNTVVTSSCGDSFNSSGISAKSAVKSNFLCKGWILLLQDESTVDNIKWLPKFLVVNKLDKSALIYDDEDAASIFVENDMNSVRMDNSVRKDMFINQWRNKSEKFDAYYSSLKIDTNSNSSTLLHQSQSSNKDFEHLDKDSLNSYSTYTETEVNTTTASTTTTPSTNPALRFAGFFFKRDKSEKLKHSTLKRAKSGIQLERKKQSLLSNNSDKNNNNNDSTIFSAGRQSTKLGRSNNYENRSSLQSQIRPSRSHESLSSPMKQHHSSTLFSNKKSNDKNKLKQIQSKASTKIENIQKLNLSLDVAPEDSPVVICPLHTSLFNEENCFELKCLNSTISVFNKNEITTPDSDYDDDEDYNMIGGSSNDLDSVTDQRRNRSKPSVKCYNSSEFYSSRYFMCRSADEREKWIQCFRNVVQPNLINERHNENSLQVWLLEAKGQSISSKPTRKYFCEILLNGRINARSCSKQKKDILFWGENFDFNVLNCNHLRVELYQESTETINTKKKSKKEKEKENLNHLSAKDSNIRSSSFVHTHSPNHTLLGYVNIPVNSIESSQPVEKWYCLEMPLTDNDNLKSTTNGITMDPVSTSSNSSSTAISNSASIGSLTTTQNFSKDSITIRIKAKYQCVDILPLQCYSSLIEHIRVKYLELMVELEPHLNVRVKDDLANSLVRIAHKLQIQTRFLTDLVLAEVLNLEDSSLTFRGNSLATKSMESYMKLVGENYLKLTLSDCVRSIIDTAHDLEIDSSKVTNQSSLQANREELVQILHLVCGRVFNSCVNFPTEIKNVFAYLRSECKKNGKTDEMCDTLISASIFLRLICPAILSPNLFNLCQEYPQEKAARKLTLVAKTLQTIANFSKFGGKESYMSFEKMNQFVEEHTSLMREFLRNISTIPEGDLLTDYNKNILPIVTLTPQTPNKPSKKCYTTSPSIEITDFDPSNEQKSKFKNFNNFDLDLIDLGKQLSIVHSLLTTIISSLDESTRAKFNPALIKILNDLNNMKSKCHFEIQPLKLEVEPQVINSKLYSYDNRLHQAIVKNQQQNQPQITLLPLSTAAYDLSGMASSQPDLSRDNHLTLYSSQYNLDSHHLTNINNIEQAKKLENEINILKSKLRDTEISLKKEQNEKFLVESKLKQQQHNNDQQMREIINRLIKVEEELRKEQLEMHKVLKAKQELIEIQKKRIEYLSGRSSSSNSINSNYFHHHQPNQLQKQNIASLNHTLVAGYNNKLKQLNSNKNLNKTHEQKIQTEPILSNGITTALSSTISLMKNAALPTTSHSLNATMPVSSSAKFNDNISAQIAASPSSSSSSMTQFCNYLATNSLIDANNFNLKKNFRTNQNINTNANSHLLVDALSSTSSSSSGLSNSSSLNHLNQNHSISVLRHSEL